MGRSRAWTQRRADETARLLTLIEMGCIETHGLWWNARNGECLQHAFKIGDEDVTQQVRRLIKIGRVALSRGSGMERYLRVIEPKDSAIPPWTTDMDQLKMEVGTFYNITIKGPTDAKENSQTETDEAQRAHPDGGGTGGGGAPMV